MATNSESIFYKIGQATKQNVESAITALKAADNTWTGTNDFQKAVSVGTDSAAANLTVKGGISSTSSLTAGGGATITGGALTVGTGGENQNLAVNGNTTISGNLTVNGTTTTISTTNLEIQDNFVHLSKGANSGATYNKDSGLLFERAQGLSNTAIIWDESDDVFVLGTTASAGTADALDAVTPGDVKIGKLSINDQEDGILALGDLHDFQAGLTANVASDHTHA